MVERCLLLIRSWLTEVFSKRSRPRPATEHTGTVGAEGLELPLPEEVEEVVVSQLREAYIHHVLPPASLGLRSRHVFCRGEPDEAALFLGFPVDVASSRFVEEVGYLIPLLRRVWEEMVLPLQALPEVQGGAGGWTVQSGPATVVCVPVRTGAV